MSSSTIRFTFVFSILALFFVATCGKDSPTKPEPPEPPPPPAPVATRIEITPANVDLNSLGQTVQLTARVIDQNNNTMSGAVVAWTTTNSGVAAVTDQGRVTSVGNGTARITATSGSVSSGIDVKVMQQAGRIVIEPDGATLMSIGATVQLTAAVLDGNGKTVADAVVAWQSSDEAVATVSATGLVIAVRNGTARITATSGSVSSGIDVKVMQSAGSIVIEPQLITLESIGATVQLTATVLDGHEQPVENAVLSWNSSDETVATVSAQGLVTAVSNGTAQITAITGEISASTTVTVKAQPDRDREALVALYNGMAGPNWTNSTNWLTDEPLGSWHGVRTRFTDRVFQLDLSQNGLKGSIPPEIGLLSGMEILVLGGNELSGAVPLEIGGLKLLKQLILSSNKLTSVPPEIGQMESLVDLSLNENALTEIPSGIGQLKNLKDLNLSRNRLTAVPPEIGQMESLQSLSLGNNDLTSSSIPPEIGSLRNLRFLSIGWNALNSIPAAIMELSDLHDLWLSSNQLSGEIPPGIGQMTGLRQLILQTNQLSGEIPPEIGRLKNLETLLLNVNQLSGEIPPEIAQLRSLQRLMLHQNQLTGSIPREIGLMDSLQVLRLHTNRLTGEIPAEVGQMVSLESLDVSDNDLIDEIPAEVGQLERLRHLSLENNQLSGSIPPEFGRLKNLESLNLGGNSGLSGPIPREIAELPNLTRLSVNDTQLCLPRDPVFDDFLQRLLISRIPRCEGPSGSIAYLVQATQSATYPVPLVAGEDALLRVFVLGNEEVEAEMPSVRATFVNGGTEVHTVEIRADASKIPSVLDEGSLSASANAVVPGSVISPGLEFVVEIDPDRSLYPSGGIQSRIPETGRMAVEVLDVPPLHLNVVPLVWMDEPDMSVVTESEALTADDELFRLTRDLLPVRDVDFQLTIHDPWFTSLDPVYNNRLEMLEEVQMFQMMDGRGGHYMGILRDGAGSSIRGTAVSVSGLIGDTIAHELGHNMSLLHPPCEGFTGRRDPFYPYPDGNIGVWGYDFLTGTVVPPDTPDLMSYCGPPDWISDYHLSKAIRYLQTENYMESTVPQPSAEAARVLLLSGRVSERGEVVLNPAFVVDAAPSIPSESGPYWITGEDADGDVLFSVSFEMSGITGGKGGVFAFTIPVEPSWQRRLERIGLSGPEGFAIQDTTRDTAMALLRDVFSGKVRGLLRDLQVTSTGAVYTRRILPEPGLEVVISNGVPGLSDW